MWKLYEDGVELGSFDTEKEAQQELADLVEDAAEKAREQATERFAVVEE